MFNIDNVKEFMQVIKDNLIFPYVNINYSTLGGNDNISILLIVSLDNKSIWINNILENSRYIKLYIDNKGYCEYVSGSIKIIKLQFSTAFDLVNKLNIKIK